MYLIFIDICGEILLQTGIPSNQTEKPRHVLSHFIRFNRRFCIQCTFSFYNFSNFPQTVVVIIKIAQQNQSTTHLFFETPQMLTLFVSLGKYLEKVAEKRTTDAIQTILDCEAKTACLMDSSSVFTDNIEQLIVNLKSSDCNYT